MFLPQLVDRPLNVPKSEFCTFRFGRICVCACAKRFDVLDDSGHLCVEYLTTNFAFARIDGVHRFFVDPLLAVHWDERGRVAPRRRWRSL